MANEPSYKRVSAPAGQPWLDPSDHGYTSRIPPINAPRVSEIVQPGASRSIVAAPDPNTDSGSD